MRAPVVVCYAERDRRPHERLELGSRTLRDLERDVHVRPQRAVVAVVLGRPDGNDDPPPASLQVLAYPEVSHLGHEDGRGHPGASYESPSEVRCSRERRIASVTSSSGGHGSPSNSISTESGPS